MDANVLVQEDNRFLRELFSQLQDEAIPEEKYRELVSISSLIHSPYSFSCFVSLVFSTPLSFPPILSLSSISPRLTCYVRYVHLVLL